MTAKSNIKVFICRINCDGCNLLVCCIANNNILIQSRVIFIQRKTNSTSVVTLLYTRTIYLSAGMRDSSASLVN